MILQQLYRDAEAIIGQVYDGLPLPPPMYTYQPLAYVIEIDPLTNRAELVALPQGDRKKGERTRSDCLPYLGRTSGVAAILLVDKPAYVLGIDDGKAASAGTFKARNCETQAAFRELAALCHQETNIAEIQSVLKFLSRWNPAKPEFAIPGDLKSNDLIGFRVIGGGHLSDHPSIQRFWASYTRDNDTRRLRCLVTDSDADIETKLPLGVKGVPGAQTSGAPISSFNVNAFESYGLREFSAPISRDAGEQSTKALNALLGSRRHCTVVGSYDSGVVYAYWSAAGMVPLAILAENPSDDDIDGVFGLAIQADYTPADQTAVGTSIQAPRTGNSVEELPDPNAEFHIVALSSHSGGRVAIRSNLTLSIKDVILRQRNWFERVRMVAPNGTRGRPLGIPALAVSAFRERKEMPNRLIHALVETALNDALPPIDLLPGAVRRCQIGTVIKGANGRERREHVTYARASLIKFLLTWPDPEKANRMSDFDATNQDAAHRCGRLLYQLERIQYLAVGRVNATLVDRFYGGASTTPQTVFPNLMRMAKQAHLPTIRRERGAWLAGKLQDEIAEITEPLGVAFPPYLELLEQGSFALGYYQERAKIAREIAEANTDQSGTGATDAPETEDMNDVGDLEEGA